MVRLNYNESAVAGSGSESSTDKSQTLHKIVRTEIHLLAEEIV